MPIVLLVKSISSSLTNKHKKDSKIGHVYIGMSCLKSAGLNIKTSILLWLVRVLDANRTLPSGCVAKSQPIRGFPAIEPGMASANQRLSCH